MEKYTPLLESWLLIYDAILIFYIHDNILIKYVVNFMKWLKISCWDFFLHILSHCCRLFQSLQVVREIWASFLFSCFYSNSVIHKLLLGGEKRDRFLGMPLQVWLFLDKFSFFLRNEMRNVLLICLLQRAGRFLLWDKARACSAYWCFGGREKLLFCICCH